MTRTRTMTIVAGFAFALWTAGTASAGNIAITGHDDDFHAAIQGLGSDPSNQLKEMVRFARNGSALKILTFDQGTELTSSLTALGIAFDNISTAAGAAAVAFDPTVYSAFVTASDSTCGGCDNDTT